MNLTISGPVGTQPHRVADAMAALASATDQLRLGWMPEGWRRVSGPGPDFVPMIRTDRLQPRAAFDAPMAAFDGLVLEPGKVLELELDLELPESIGGVALAGDALQMTIESLYAMTVSVDDVVILDDTIPLAAGGAALIDVIPEIRPGSNGKLNVAFRPPSNQLDTGWNLFTFGTPGLQRRFELLDLAHAQLMLATALAEDGADHAALAAAVALVPEELTAPDDVLRPALEAVEQELARFEHRAQTLHVHVIGHSHIDLNWQWTWPDTVEVVRRDFRSILSMLDDYPEMTFVHSQPVTYDVIRSREPELFEKVLAHIRDGRWEPATMQWTETDSNIPSGESHAGAVRRPADGRERNAQRWADVGNAEYGVALLNESKYGYDALGARLRLTLVRTAYNPDVDSDTGHHDSAFSFVPHLGDWCSAGIPEQAAGFNQPLIARVAAGESTGPTQAWRPRVEGGGGVFISSVKRENAGPGVAVRLYEGHGCDAQVTLAGLPDGAEVISASIVEDEIESLPVTGSALSIAFRPWEVRTLLARPAQPASEG